MVLFVSQVNITCLAVCREGVVKMGHGGDVP